MAESDRPPSAYPADWYPGEVYPGQDIDHGALQRWLAAYGPDAYSTQNTPDRSVRGIIRRARRR